MRTRTSNLSANREHARHSAFTLIELVIITIVLVLMAACIVPRMIALTRSRALFEVEAAIQRAPLEARNEARRSQVPVRLRVENGALLMEWVLDSQNQQQQPNTAMQANPPTLRSDGVSPQEFKRITLGDDIQVQYAQRNNQNSDLGSWQWTVYPDGSADTAGLQFSEGNKQKSLVLTNTGDGQWLEGALPDTSQQQWPAGELQQRGTS